MKDSYTAQNSIHIENYFSNLFIHLHNLTNLKSTISKNS